MSVLKARRFFWPLALALIVLCGWAASEANAGNWSDARLDAVASNLAGKPVTVWCEDSWLPWESFWAGQGRDGTNIGGFTYPLSGTVLYVNPHVCGTLHALLSREDVGAFYTAQAILILNHEATHQRLRTLDEALTECWALKTFRQAAVEQFQVPATVSETVYVAGSKLVRRRVRGRIVKIRVATVKTIVATGPNPYLELLVQDARRWDAAMPANYHGATC